MKRIFTLLFITFSFISLTTSAQGFNQGDLHPVEWQGTVKQESDGSYDLIFKAEIEDNWHIFSQFTAEGGSLPMGIEYLDDGKTYNTNGKTKESKTSTRYNEVFGVDETIFEHQATLTQNITVEDNDLRYVKAQLNYQVCQESCINEEYYFVFDLENKSAKIFSNYDEFEAFGNDNTTTSAAKETTREQVESRNNTEESQAESQDNSEVESISAGGSFLGNQSNIKSPVKWKAEVEQNSEDDFNLAFKGAIKDGWHIFSQFTPDGGSLPMKIDFLDEGEAYTINGKAEESKTKKQFNNVFGVDEIIFENNAVVTQNINLKDKDTRYIKAQMSYQVCQESCINEEYYFVFDLKEKTAQVFNNYDKFEAFGKEGAELKTDQSGEEAALGVKEDDSSGAQRSMWTIFILAFLWGFTALLTPCVFPMIPMTVSFFIKQSKTKAIGKRNAILYALFIVVIYVLLGSIVTAIFGADSLNKLSTNVIFNIVFFLLLVVFAASFLGAFEITLPNSWANKADKQANRGGIIGIFFMALALAIVSFSCTGPIIGFVLVQAASSGGIAPIVGMLGFSLALAIPFGLFALFPSWLNSMPKSGGWLNTVKVVLGFLELAFAFKFLSNADLVMQANLLPREIFLAIWVAIFGVMAVYLFGKLQLPNDTKTEYISVGRLGLGLLTLSFVIYLIPGLWGAPLKLISGFPPPMTYSESPDGVGYSKAGAITTDSGANDELNAGAVPGPHDILAFRDYDKGIAYAKKVGKPVMLDFTGMACVNCRKMEERVWSEPQILAVLKNDVVMISLYVDVDKKLPKDEQYTSETTGKRIRTVGNKWSDFQIKNYGVNAQPYYVLLSHEEKELNKPVGYMPDVDDYEAWLKEGIDKYFNK